MPVAERGQGGGDGPAGPRPEGPAALRASRRGLGLPAADDPGQDGPKALAFGTLLLLIVFTEFARHAIDYGRAGALPLTLVNLAAAAAALAAIPFFRSGRGARSAAGATLVLVLAALAPRFPDVGNHHYLYLYVLSFLAFFDWRRDGGERLLMLDGLRVMTALMFFFTGLQKLLYGLYWDGQYFAYLMATGSRFGDLFRHLLPGAELARLAAIDAGRAGAGPFRLEWWPMVAASRAVVFGEMMLPALLLVPRTRTIGLAGAFLLIVAIELGAREFLFGALFVSLALLFAPRAPSRRLVPCAALLSLLLLAIRIVRPDWSWG